MVIIMHMHTKGIFILKLENKHYLTSPGKNSWSCHMFFSFSFFFKSINIMPTNIILEVIGVRTSSLRQDHWTVRPSGEHASYWVTNILTVAYRQKSGLHDSFTNACVKMFFSFDIRVIKNVVKCTKTLCCLDLIYTQSDVGLKWTLKA